MKTKSTTDPPWRRSLYATPCWRSAQKTLSPIENFTSTEKGTGRSGNGGKRSTLIFHRQVPSDAVFSLVAGVHTQRRS